MTNDETRALILDAIARIDRMTARYDAVIHDFQRRMHATDPVRFARLKASVDDTYHGLRSCDRKDVDVALQLIVHHWPAEVARGAIDTGIELLTDSDDNIAILATGLLRKARSETRDRALITKLIAVIENPNRSDAVRCEAYCAACVIHGLPLEHWTPVALAQDTSLFDLNLLQ